MGFVGDFEDVGDEDVDGDLVAEFPEGLFGISFWHGGASS